MVGAGGKKSETAKYEGTLNYMMKIFAFAKNMFLKDEFHFYLDTLFTGIMNTGVVQGEKEPIKEFRGKRVYQNDIEKLVDEIFGPEDEALDRQVFIEKLLVHDELGPMFKYFQDSYSGSSKYCKSRAMEMIHINQMILKLLYEIVKKSVYKVEEPGTVLK